MITTEQLAAAIQAAADWRARAARSMNSADSDEARRAQEHAERLRRERDTEQAALAARQTAEQTPAARKLAAAAARDLEASGDAVQAAMDGLAAALRALDHATAEHASTVAKHAAAVGAAGLGFAVAGCPGAPTTLAGQATSGVSAVKVGDRSWRAPEPGEALDLVLARHFNRGRINWRGFSTVGQSILDQAAARGDAVLAITTTKGAAA